ncbi:hypothetical protein [Halobacteriovorax sp. RZ-2]|uniref:hypothetical protein n=1 Tax=unclassified Halobacteriovorax TaxID=2639665 RepID=UPI0037219D18
MSKATETINHEYFGNLSIKGIKEIEGSVKPTAMLPKTWGWPVIFIIVIGLVFYFIYQKLIYMKKYGPYIRVYKRLTKEDSIQDIYLLYKRISKISFGHRIDDRFLLNSAKGEYTKAEQESLNNYLYQSQALDEELEVSLKKRMLSDIGHTLKARGRVRD